MIKNTRELGAMLLIAGTCIGAGMLALPVISAPSGFYFSVLLLLVCWFFMYCSGLLVLEVNLALREDTSYISMAKATLGWWGGFVTWLFFLLLLYSLLAAYIAGGGDLIHEVAKSFWQLELGKNGPWIWSLFFGLIIFFGVGVADYLNRFFMGGLIAAFITLIAVSLPHINANYLFAGHGQYVLLALPVVFTAMAFHIIVPSLRRYLNSDIPAIRRVILAGSLLPLIVYILWELVLFGLIPINGEQGLIAILKSGHTTEGITHSLNQLLNSSWLGFSSRMFVLFAIASSFIGVAYGLFDLLADGLKMEKTYRGRLFVAVLTLLPPLLYALYYPKGFIIALSYAGIFVAVVHGILPVIMAWRARSQTRLHSAFQVPGGSSLLIAVLIFFSSIILVEIASFLQLIPRI